MLGMTNSIGTRMHTARGKTKLIGREGHNCQNTASGTSVIADLNGLGQLWLLGRGSRRLRAILRAIGRPMATELPQYCVHLLALETNRLLRKPTKTVAEMHLLEKHLRRAVLTKHAPDVNAPLRHFAVLLGTSVEHLYRYRYPALNFGSFGSPTMCLAHQTYY